MLERWLHLRGVNGLSRYSLHILGRVNATPNNGFRYLNEPNSIPRSTTEKPR